MRIVNTKYIMIELKNIYQKITSAALDIIELQHILDILIYISYVMTHF